MASCRPEADSAGADMRDLLERALIVAAEAQQQLAEQSRRILTLETLSYKDELTGLLNRRGFNQQLRQALALARRIESTGVLSFIDLDNFKAINDEPGHQAGEQMLGHVADLLDENLRATDVAARFGGDEFAIILIHTTPRSGRLHIAALEQEANSSLVTFEAAKIPVRASFGTVAFGCGDEANNLIDRADADMYRKKHAKPLVLRPWLHRQV
ncbi:MAG: GGDEF domain-containing protein [Alphaproteobacteria bacterium]